MYSAVPPRRLDPAEPKGPSPSRRARPFVRPYFIDGDTPFAYHALRSQFSQRTPTMAYSRDCLFCATRFVAKLDRRIFCSSVCRMRYNREERLRCFYCGELASSRDHIYPQSARMNGGSNFEGQETVNVCMECNSAMTDKFAHSLELRIEYLIAWTEKRYKLEKIIPEWDDDEIKELGYSLRVRIQAKIRERQRAIERTLHMRATWRMVLLANNL